MSIIDLSIYALLLLIIGCLVAYVILTAPMGLEYFKAAISKDKYSLFILDKNGVFRFRTARFRNGGAVLPKGIAKYIKNGLHGSYSFGSIRCDVIHSSIAPMIEDTTLGVFEELKKIGIEDIDELTMLYNKATLLKYNVINPKTLTPAEKERIEYVSKYVMENTKLLAPAVRELKIHDMLKNCTVDPNILAADTEEQTALIAAQYAKLIGKRKTPDGSPNTGMIMVIGIIIVVIGLAAAFFMMG